MLPTLTAPSTQFHVPAAPMVYPHGAAPQDESVYPTHLAQGTFLQPPPIPVPPVVPPVLQQVPPVLQQQVQPVIQQQVAQPVVPPVLQQQVQPVVQGPVDCTSWSNYLIYKPCNDDGTRDRRVFIGDENGNSVGCLMEGGVVNAQMEAYLRSISMGDYPIIYGMPSADAYYKAYAIALTPATAFDVFNSIVHRVDESLNVVPNHPFYVQATFANVLPIDGRHAEFFVQWNGIPDGYPAFELPAPLVPEPQQAAQTEVVPVPQPEAAPVALDVAPVAPEVAPVAPEVAPVALEVVAPVVPEPQPEVAPESQQVVAPVLQTEVAVDIPQTPATFVVPQQYAPAPVSAMPPAPVMANAAPLTTGPVPLPTGVVRGVPTFTGVPAGARLPPGAVQLPGMGQPLVAPVQQAPSDDQPFLSL